MTKVFGLDQMYSKLIRRDFVPYSAFQRILICMWWLAITILVFIMVFMIFISHSFCKKRIFSCSLFIDINTVITPYLHQRFVNGMKAPSVRRISIRGNHFILINSMALEGDNCFLCRSTEITVKKIASKFYFPPFIIFQNTLLFVIECFLQISLFPIKEFES